jgi:hypothetical protein
MPDVSWPAALPQKMLASGFSQSPGATVARTQAEFGRPNARVRDFSTHEIIAGQFRMTIAQFNTFRAFWLDDLGQGVLPFDWVHPISGEAKICQMIDDYRASASGPYMMIQIRMAVW